MAESIEIGGYTYRRRLRYSTGWERRVDHSPELKWLWMGSDIDDLLDEIVRLRSEVSTDD